MKLEVVDLQKSFDNKEILKNINFTFEQGKIYGLLGRNGAGKTTFFNCLNDDVTPDKGTFYIKEENHTRLLRIEDIGYVLSTPVVPEFLTGREFLKFFLEINEEKIKDAKTIDEYFDFMKIDEKDRDKLLKDYSHGMKNKMQMLVNIIANPNILLLDEPLTSLDVIVAEEMKEMLEMVLKKGKKPLVIDADGLNIISRFNMKIEYPYGTIMTPHLMEAARLMSCDITQIKEDLCQSAQDLAEKYHCTAVLKDATTIVAREDDLVYINQSGNDGMATGGSGDVLAGMITGLLGEGLSVHEAAVHGVYLHGLAGDHAKHDLGAYSMIASDIIAHIKDVTGGNYEPVL